MNNEQLEDLKQFISASVSQTEERIRSEMGQQRKDMNQGFQAVRQEMADGFLGVGDAIDEIHKQMDSQASATDKRLTKLERRVF